MTDAEKASADKANEAARASCPLPYGCANILMTPFYSSPGSADALMRTLESGEARALFSACLAVYRGQIKEGERAVERMLDGALCYESRACCAILLSTCSLHLGSTYDWNRAKALFTSLERQRPNSAALAASRASINCSIYIDDAPDWLQRGIFTGFSPASQPSLCYLYAKLLLVRKKYDSLLAVVEPLISYAHAEKVLLAELYLHLTAAAAYRYAGDEAHMEEHIEAALDLALPDRLYAPLAESRVHISAALDIALKRRDPEAFSCVRMLFKRLAWGFIKMHNAVTGKRISSELTVREYEIADMAIRGMRNAEIAERLGLVESSVKKYLSTLYQKLGISKRSELGKFMF